jgi:probable HAF family extracellular repeat protein
VVCALAPSFAFAFAQSAFVPLGELIVGGGFSSASGVSSFETAGGLLSGLVVVGNAEGAAGREAFRWTQAGGMVGLGDLGGAFSFSNAAAVDATGAVVVGASVSPTGIFGYRWSDTLGMVSLGDLPGGPEQSEANDIAADGQTVVGSSRSTAGPLGNEAFVWTPAGGMVGLGRLGGVGLSVAHGVSGDGSIAVGSSGPEPETSFAFRWTAAGGMAALPSLPGVVEASEALGVSEDGSAIVGWIRLASQGQLAVRWTGGGVESLGRPAPFGDAAMFPQAASEDGSVIVGWGEIDALPVAFFWTQGGGVRPLAEVLEADFGLDLSGWTLSVALDVSTHAHSGRTAIVGAGVNPAGRSEAFLAVLDPAPPCPVDLDGDGSATIFDFLAFQTLFDAGDARADFDGDGLLTVFDFLRFFDAFDIGCP